MNHRLEPLGDDHDLGSFCCGQRDDVVNLLLTGNVAGGAEAKLRHYGGHGVGVRPRHPALL